MTAWRTDSIIADEDWYKPHRPPEYADGPVGLVQPVANRLRRRGELLTGRGLRTPGRFEPLNRVSERRQNIGRQPAGDGARTRDRRAPARGEHRAMFGAHAVGPNVCVMPPSYVCLHRCVPFILLKSFDTDRRQQFTHDRIECGTRVPGSVRMIHARIVFPLVALPGGWRARAEGTDRACLRGLAPVRQTPALRLVGASLRPMRDVPYTRVRARSPVRLAGVYRQVAPHDEHGAG